MNTLKLLVRHIFFSELRNSLLLRSSTLFLVVCLTANLSAKTTISVNFYGSDINNSLTPAESTGVVFANNWNNFEGGEDGIGLVVIDSDGVVVPGVTLDYDQTGVGSTSNYNNGLTTAQGKLFDGGTRIDFGTGTFALNGLGGYSSYDIYVYYSGGTSFPEARHGEITSPGISDTYYVAGIGSVNTAYTQSNNIVDNGSYDPGNYVLLENLSGATQTVSMSFIENGMVLTGFQFVGTTIPEPSAYASLVGLLCFAIVAVRMRRKTAVR